MAILKHSSSKNASYSDALDYLKYKHNEDDRTGLYEPILDEFGLLQERENYAICSLNGYGQEQDPELWAGSCMETNILYGKNNTKGERKQHIYVISHPEADAALLTKEALLEEGKAFVRENLPGYDALIAVHMDTDHPHVHVAINSVRAVERDERPWMMHNEDGKVLRSEVAAGGKHQDNPDFRHHCQDWLLKYSRSHGLTLEDNNRIEAERKAQRYAKKHKDLYDKVIGEALGCHSIQKLRENLKKNYDIDLIQRSKTFSLHLPGSKRNIRLTTIGIDNSLLYGLVSTLNSDKKRMLQEEAFRIEKKKYVQWLHERRLKNNARAEDTLADIAELIACRIGPRYFQEDFRDLNDLIKQTTYLERDLNTELDKIDRLVSRWLAFLAPDTPPEEKAKHESFVRWCGCNPLSQADLFEIQSEREVVALQIKEAASLRQALVDSADKWKESSGFRFRRDWTMSRTDQLKQALKDVKANRKKLGQIAYNCQKAADRRIYKEEYLKKAEHFRQLWHDKLEEEKALKEQIKEQEKAEKQRQRRKAKGLER